MTREFNSFLIRTIDEYVALARREFDSRISAWKIDVFDKETCEAVGGLLARQLSLATNTARSPFIWNIHVLPVILRCMADVYVTFCWIAKNPSQRARMFVEYGLGQEKLAIEKYREALSEESEPDPEAEQYIDVRSQLLEMERTAFLLPVNIGSWSEMNMRDMAIEVGEKKFYDLVFTQFSAAVHSTWQHILRANLVPCTNPLHMGHRFPADIVCPPDPRMFVLSAKYLCKTFAAFDSTFLKSERDAYACLSLLDDRFESYFNKRETNRSVPKPKSAMKPVKGKVKGKKGIGKGAKTKRRR